MVEKLWIAIKDSINADTFIKIKLSFDSNEELLKHIQIRKIVIKTSEKYSVVYSYNTKDITQNYNFEQLKQFITEKIKNPSFKQGILFTINNDILFKKDSNDNLLLKTIKPSISKSNKSHDKVKKEVINLHSSYLYHLGITNAEGIILKNSRDKYNQIKQYIELLHPHIETLIKKGEEIKIVDMGCGKGYLTFALCDYINDKYPASSCKVIGVEMRNDLVVNANKLSEQCKMNNLHFEVGTIASYKDNNIDLLIALHACDTATDDAIIKGIESKASLIVVAPCCHQQIRKSMEQNKQDNPMKTLISHGIFLERQATMITDTIRAEVLNYCEYKTKIVEFVSDAHTPKNVMIIAEKTSKPHHHRVRNLDNIAQLKDHFGIDNHYIEKVISISE